jgi:hypothetical protein
LLIGSREPYVVIAGSPISDLQTVAWKFPAFLGWTGGWIDWWGDLVRSVNSSPVSLLHHLTDMSACCFNLRPPPSPTPTHSLFPPSLPPSPSRPNKHP